MDPVTLARIAAWLLAEAVNAGVQISQVLAEARASGKISAEQWDNLIAEMERNEAAWKAAPGPAT